MRYLFTFFSFFYLYSNAQNIPEAYYFSENSQQLLRGGGELVEGFYSESNIDTLFLYFNQIDYWNQLESNYCDKTNIAATLIYQNEIFNDVGVRFKGQTSYFNTNGDTGGGGPCGGGPG